MSNSVTYIGTDYHKLQNVIVSGIDHGGNAIEPFIDEAGGWPLRCCLSDSASGDEIAIIAWSPFDWSGPYCEVGPIVVHTQGCSGRQDTDSLPANIEEAPMVLRPYGHDRRIAYGHVRHIAADQSLAAQVAELLQIDEIDFVQGRNITGGCYSFTASRQ